MLNPEKDKDFIDSLENLETTLFASMAKSGSYESLIKSKAVVLKHTKTTLKAEWERVKRGN